MKGVIPTFIGLSMRTAMSHCVRQDDRCRVGELRRSRRSRYRLWRGQGRPHRNQVGAEAGTIYDVTKKQ
jgi:hypothetical protein